MKHLKTLSLLLLTALSATTAWAQGIPPMGGSSTDDDTYPAMVRLYTCNAGYTTDYTGLTYADTTPLSQNEALKILFVALNAGYSASTLDAQKPSDLFDIDCYGNLSLTTTGKTYIKDYVWSDVARATEQATFGSAYGSSGGIWLFTAGHDFDSTTTTAGVAYVVVFDSRAFDVDVMLEDYSVDTSFPYINAWNAVKVANYNFNGNSIGGGVQSVVLDVTLTGATTYAYASPTIPTLLPQSLVDDEGKTYEGDDLVAYLTPVMADVTQIADGLSLTGSSPDVITYTLQTKTSLDEEWVDFDTVAEQILADVNEKLSQNEQKTLADDFQKCYTCLRVKDSTEIKIPRSPKETQRFYRLKAE